MLDSERENVNRAKNGRSTATLAAGRKLIGAIRLDLKVFGQQVRERFTVRAEKRASTQRKPRSRKLGIAALQFFAVLVGLGIAALSIGFAWALRDVPQLAKPIAATEQPSILLKTANDEPLGRVGPFRSQGVSPDDLKSPAVAAIINTEDRRFYNHWGVDPVGILRALRRNMAAGTVIEGGSTITQQLVKVRLLGQATSLVEKLREALVAIWLDAQLTKDEILMHYLDSIYMGQGAYGVAAGARLYFDKDLHELTIAEAAVLAGLTKCPSHCNPLHDPRRAHEEMEHVIDGMLQTGLINAGAAKNAKARLVTLRPSIQAARAGSWFADWVARDIADMTGPFAGQLRAQTTLDPQLQKLAEQVVKRTLAEWGAERDVTQAALVAMRPDGGVVAMVGGRDYKASPFNRAVDAKRQPGSAFKMFVYLTALKSGFEPEQTIDASSLTIEEWEPENYDGRRFGRISLAEAFSRSINTAAVRLAQDVGLKKVIATARELGIEQPLQPYPSLALGTAEVSLLELTGAFAAVRSGRHVKPWGVASIGDGKTRFEPIRQTARQLRSLAQYREPMIDLLRRVVQHGTGRAAALDGFAAGKTGTSQNYRDAWFIGFDERLVVGIWLGNDDGNPTDRVTGGSLPARAWREFMIEARNIIGADEPWPSVATPETDANCDYQACAEHYRSFRASDCTYQPYGGGPRRLCEKGPLLQISPMAEASGAGSSLLGRRECNYDACADTYASFDSADCTYQPYGGGPRRVCEK